MSDDFDWEPHKGGSGEFVKFETINDKVVGTITQIRTHTFDVNKGPIVLIDLDTKDGPRTLSCDKVDLRMKLAEVAPQVGDKLQVEFVRTQKMTNGTMKIFEVRHKQGERPKPAEPEWDDDGQPPPSGSDGYGEEPF